MKSIQFIQVFILTLFLVFAAACTPEQIMPKGKGTWSYTTTTKVVNSVTGTFNGTSSGDITFNDDGSGTTTPSGGSASTFTWAYNASDKKMTITDGSNVIVYDVLTSKSNSQTWKNEQTSTVIGVTTTSTTDISLSRKK